MYGAELGQHLAEQDRIDEFTFCVGCGEVVYLDDRDTYTTCQDGVICNGCTAEHFPTDAAANDGRVMSFEDWKGHWAVRDGQLVTT